MHHRTPDIWRGVDYECDRRQTIVVLVDDERPSAIHTGLVDKDGNPILRVIERRPIGFIHAPTAAR